jgi:hypothetical protein
MVVILPTLPVCITSLPIYQITVYRKLILFNQLLLFIPTPLPHPPTTHYGTIKKSWTERKGNEMKTGLFPIFIPLHECPETHRLVGIYVCPTRTIVST